MEDESPIVNAANQLPPKWGQGAPLPEPGPISSREFLDLSAVWQRAAAQGEIAAAALRAQARAQAERRRLIAPRAPGPAVEEPCPPLRHKRAFEV